MFRFANENDRENLYSLWHSCFGDNEDFVYPFFDTFLKEDNVYIFEDGGKIASAVYALDCKIGEKKAIYFYAVATDESYRRRGLAKAEIEFLIDYKSKAGFEFFLLTASSEKNNAYYKKLGFEDAFFCKKVNVFSSENSLNITEFFDRKKLFELREKLSRENNFVSFPEKHFNFAIDFSEHVFVETKDEKYVSYALVQGGNIIEALSYFDTEKFVSSVLKRMGKKEGKIYLPISIADETSCCNISRGMVYCSDNKNLEKTFLSLNLE